jgi:M6 family metalloprotease-like protein
MKKCFTTFAIITLIIASSLQVFGVIAYPNPIEYNLPDGTTITIKLMGDEKVKWAETADGFSILLNKDGYYEYTMQNAEGDMVRSGVRANNKSNRSSEEIAFLSKVSPNLRFSKSQTSALKQIWEIREQEIKSAKAFPPTGNRKLVCILIGFKDKPFGKTYQDFNSLFNQVGYTAGGATGSVKDYHTENSYGQLNLTVDVAGPYTAAENMAFYGANDASDNDVKPRELVREAVILANPDVNYADYDNDNDGVVDAVYIIYAGYGEEAGGGADAIWAHAWSIYNYPTSAGTILDGKRIGSYSCSAELRGNTGTNITRIGVICHEFGHVLGAPDYYDTDYDTGGQFIGTGLWDLMAGGTWNGGGASPAHHNGFTKVVVFDWATATVLNTQQSVTLNNASENKTSFYRINTSTTGEYFFIENREKHKFDAGIPGSGMLIYHVHSGVFNVGNKINTTHPQRMYVVSQNASMDPTSEPSSYGNINFASAAWTGALATKNAFTDASLPSSKSWAGANTEKPITNISRNATNKTVSFDFMATSTPRVTFFSEGFEGLVFPPIGWTVESTVTNFSWKITTGYGGDGIVVNPQEGTKFAFVQWQDAANQNEWLITPAIDLREATDIKLSFYFNGSYYWSVTNNNCDLRVKAKIGDGAWTDIWAENNFGVWNDYVWHNVVLSNLTAYEGQNNVKFAFVYSGNDGDNFGIDNIVLSKSGVPNSLNNSTLSNIKVYPNPFSGSINLENVDDVERVTLTNLIGQTIIVLNLKGTSQEIIPTDKLSNGIYLITLHGINGQKLVRKIIKQ